MDEEIADKLEVCRTCGIYSFATPNFMRQIFSSEYTEIRNELSTWNVQISPEDDFSQFICTSCIFEFQRVFKLRSLCRKVHRNFQTLLEERGINAAAIKIKQEKVNNYESEIGGDNSGNDNGSCFFVYIDDLSDNEDETEPHEKIPNFPVPKVKLEYIDEINVPPICNTTNENNLEIQVKCEATSPDLITKVKIEQNTNFENSQIINNSNTNHNVDINAVKSEDSNLKCNLCYYIAKNQQQHDEHVRMKHDIKTQVCHICGKEFENSTAARLKYHLKWHKLNNHSKCTQCGFICSSRIALNQHVRNMHSTKECDICGIQLTPRAMKDHTRHAHVNIKFDYCEQGLSNEIDRDNHIYGELTMENNKETQSIDNSNNVDSSKIDFGSQESIYSIEESEDDEINSKEIDGDEKAANIVDDIYENNFIDNITFSTLCEFDEDDNSGDVKLQEQVSVMSVQENFTEETCENYTMMDLDNEDENQGSEQEEDNRQSGFKCKECSKVFELRFSFNRHMKKHK